jgi:hypothetical protein
MPRSKKGRLSGTARKEINERRAADAVSGRADGVIFARVTKMTGANHVRVAIDSRHGARELIARIPNIFARRGATPITIRDIVSIYVGPDFNPDAPPVTKSTEHFDITAVLTARQANALVGEGVIPSWMLHEDAASAAIGKEVAEAGFVFDYGEIREDASAEESSDEEDAAAVAAAAAGAGFSRKVARDAVDVPGGELDIDAI